MALGQTYATSLLDWIFNQGTPSSIAAIWMSLHTADPGATGAAECADATYARVNVTAAFSPASAGAVTNSAAVEYAALTTGATITHYGLWTLVTGGAFIHGGDVTPDKAVGAGEIPRFAVGEIDVTA